MECRCPDCNRLLFKVDGDILAIKCRCGRIAKVSIERLRNIVGQLGLDAWKDGVHGDLLEDDSHYACGRYLFYIDEGGIHIDCHKCKGKWQYSLDDFSVRQPDWDYVEDGPKPLTLIFPDRDDS